VTGLMRHLIMQNSIDTKKEYDFSKGERGKFFRADAELSLPVYLDPDVARAFRNSAAVNEALRSLLRISAITRRLTRPSSGRAASTRR
jgi:hypothetical protein